MKKVCGVLCGLMICCNSVLGNVSLNNRELFDERASEGIEVHLKEDREYEILPLKEQILTYFEDGQKLLYNRYIADDERVTQGDIAKIVCEYINRQPIYLPEKDLCQNPFIGRLVIEGIWGNWSYDERQLITLNDWDYLFHQANQFREDPDYVKKALEASATNIKKTINQYRKDSNRNWSYESVSLGSITQSHMNLSLEGQAYQLYQFEGTNYVNLNTLEKIGFLKRENSNNLLQFIWQAPSFKEDELLNITSKDTYINNEEIYIGELKTYSLITGENTFIPVRALEVYFDLHLLEDQVILVPKVHVMSDMISCNENIIINESNQPLKLMYTDLYWDGEQIVENQSGLVEIQRNGRILKNTHLYALRKAHYLTTIIKYIETDYNVLIAEQKFGQDISNLLKKYHQAIDQKKLVDIKKTQPLFPESIIIGTMKYATNGFVKGQKVEIWAAEDGVSYKIKDAQHKIVNVPWNSISIPKDPAPAKDKPTKEQIEDFINSKDMSSGSAYLVWTDLYRQQTYIFEGKKNEWKLIRTLLSSTGKNITPTPRGIFELKGRVPYFGVNKGYRAKNAFHIFGDYLYHSIIFDVTGTRLLEGKGVLGRRASQGCIRFSEEDSLWFYNTMKTNTKVWIN